MADHEVVSVYVPGSFHVHYDMDSGKVVGMYFTPHASDAGYFGPAAEVDYSVTDCTDEVSPDAAGLNVEDTDGPFWSAVQEALVPHTVFNSMDNDDDSTVDIYAVPIEWSE